MNITKKIAALAVTGALLVTGLSVAQSAQAARIPGTITVTPTSGNASDTIFLNSIAVSVGAPQGFRAISGTFVYQDGFELGSIANLRDGSMAEAAGTDGLDGLPVFMDRSIIPTNNFVSNKRLDQLLLPLVTGDFELRFYYFANSGNPDRVTDPYVKLDMTYNSVTGAWAVAPFTPPTTARLAGANRFETAIEISSAFAADVERVYVATGFGFADALGATPAAAHFDSPLLLTPSDSVPANVLTEIVRLSPETIVVTGGAAVISNGVVAQLEALAFNPTVVRIGGANRFETSRLIAQDAFGLGGATTAYIATGANFPDALAAGPAAATFDGPVVLVDGAASTVDSATLALLNGLGVTDIRIAGGTAVVSAAIQTQLTGLYASVTRNAGGNRFETAVAINADAFDFSDTVFLATGFNFADALTGAALAGFLGAPLFVVEPTCVPQAVLDAITDLDAEEVVLLGGNAALSSAVASLTSCSV